MIDKKWKILFQASINDADPETRKIGRGLFMQLDQEYKKQADMLYKVSFNDDSIHSSTL